MSRPQARVPLPRLVAYAHELADISAKAILPYFRRALRIDNKSLEDGVFDPVTAADRAAELAIAKSLSACWPDHGLEGEEYGRREGRSKLRWVVDPIDGTRAFIMGLPVWGTLIGLMEAETPVLGLMNQPYTRERFWSGGRASHFRGADGRERRLKTRPCPSLAEAMLSTTHPDLFAPGAEQGGFQALKRRARASRYGGDCYAYCLLAAGHIDLIVEAGLKPHDIVALIPIIERAGGRVTTWDGRAASAGGRIVAAGDPRVHEEALRLLGT
jgi:histidinol phosphatase-like enzyme (inositol monophosphatase family)